MPPGEYHTYSSARLQRKYPISLSQSHKVVTAGPVSRQFINVFQDKLYVSLLLPSMEAPVRGCVLEQRVFLKALRVLVERGKSTTFKSVKAQVVDAFPSNLAVCIRRDASLVSLELHMRPREKKKIPSFAVWTSSDSWLSIQFKASAYAASSPIGRVRSPSRIALADRLPCKDSMRRRARRNLRNC